MNSCCAVPVEIIASDQHKTGDTCCLVTEQTTSPSRAECPVSKTSSRKVQHRTVEHMVKPEKRAMIADVQYYYCADAACNVVYFSNDDVPLFTTDDLRVKVFAKDRSDDVNACYCYNWTRARIREQISVTGASTASTEIAKEVKAGNCLCDVKNPKGECCLGDVNQVVKAAMLHKEKV